MKPKARKFRIRRTPAEGTAGSIERVIQSSAQQAGDAAALSPRQDDGFGSQPFPGSAAASRKEEPAKVEDALARIRNEGLTSRQLRMARRLAQKHGIIPASDYDAVRQLRAKGIDPFERSSLLELVVPDSAGTAAPGGTPATGPAPAGKPGLPAAPAGSDTPNLPQTRPEAPVPAPPGSPTEAAGARFAQIAEMQQAIARRRQMRLKLFAARIGLFVALPTLLAFIYFAFIATPMYATYSEFVIQQADGTSGQTMGGIFGAASTPGTQDSTTVQSFLQSREAMMKLDASEGFIDHFSSDQIDFLKRLPADASREEAYKLYQKYVRLGYDPTEGFIRMEVIAAGPATSERFAKALISFAEEQVDNLTQRLRADQMTGANESFRNAEIKMEAAQAKVLALQEKLGVLDPSSETSSLMQQISNFEVQLAEKRLQLQQLLDNAQPNSARVSGVRGDISRLEALVGDLRSQMTQGEGGGAGSLASISGQLRMAQVDLETRTALMKESLQSLEAARIEANRQVRYLSLGVSPVAPDEATFPKVYQNTLVAFLICAGLYLLASLTISILREQVSS